MLKTIVKRAFDACGYQLSRKRLALPAHPDRPLLDMGMFLEDIRARGLNPTFILDIGANRGTWTQLARKTFPNASYLLIEPQPEMAEYLDALCRETSGCQWIQAGAGANTTTLVQTIWDDLQGSSMLPAEDPKLIKQGKQRNVAIETVDRWLHDRNLPSPDIVKLDIQGFELEALKGAAGTFGKTELYILETSLFEFLPNMPIVQDVVAFMNERDYSLYDVVGFMRRPFDGALGQLDLVFAHNKGKLRSKNTW